LNEEFLFFEEQVFGYRLMDRPEFGSLMKILEPIRRMQLPFRPMLARPISSQYEVDKWVNKTAKEALVEYKLDGERIQIHYCKNGGISLFSRNLENSATKYSHAFEQIKTNLDQVKDLEDCIIDGEIVAYDFTKNIVLPFTEVLKIERKADTQPETPTRIFLFDILKLNGKLLLDENMMERKSFLESLYDKIARAAKCNKFPIFGMIEAFRILGRDIENLEKHWHQSKLLNYEGLMIKPYGLQSFYIGGSRSIWLKLKRIAGDDIPIDTLDLVVLGLYKGKGKRLNKFGSFLLGSYDPETNEFWPVTKYNSTLKPGWEPDFRKQIWINFMRNLTKPSSKKSLKILGGPNILNLTTGSFPLWFGK